MEVVISFPYVQVLALCGIGVYRHITSVFYRDLSIHSLTFSSAYSFSISQLIKAKLFQDLNLHNSAGLLKYISSPSATKKKKHQKSCTSPLWKWVKGKSLLRLLSQTGLQALRSHKQPSQDGIEGKESRWGKKRQTAARIDQMQHHTPFVAMGHWGRGAFYPQCPGEEIDFSAGDKPAVTHPASLDSFVFTETENIWNMKNLKFPWTISTSNILNIECHI